MKQLHVKFEEDLIYFKDSYDISQRIKETIVDACEECEIRFFQSLKLLSQKKGVAVDIKEVYVELNRLAKIMEHCKYYRYFDKYAESRKQKLNDVIDSRKMRSKHQNPGPLKELYEKGSHHLIELLPLCAKLFEEESDLCENIFTGIKNVKGKFMGIVTGPFQQLAGMMDGVVESTRKHTDVNEILLITDIFEALTSSYDKYKALFPVLSQPTLGKLRIIGDHQQRKPKH